LLEYSAGAPPDQYSSDGQDWGMPIYNWEELEKDGFSWWKNRLAVAEKYYHIYRIDHIVGFFRIWAIPTGKPAIEGGFIPSEPDEWVPHGESHLRLMLSSCGMLPIGEDLGSVPSSARECLARLGISGTKVLYWEREWETEGKPFIACEKYPRFSMTTLSTHDSEPFALWYSSHEEDASPFAKFMGWEYQPAFTPEQYRQVLHLSHHSNSLFHINPLQEYFPTIPSFGYKEYSDLPRVNLPGKLLETNWACRFHPSVEEITASQDLSDLVKSLTAPPVEAPSGSAAL